VELSSWEDCADRFVGPNQEEALDVLHDLQVLMDLRYEVLRATKKRKIDPSSDQGLHVVVIDELAFYLRGGDKKVRDEFADELRDLVSRGRAAGMIVIAATQKPSHDIVPTWIRDLFSYRLAMRCTSPEASDTILGQGWATQGFSASTIDPANRGVGYLLAEGGVPIKFKASYLSDDDIDELAVRAAGIRSHW
jgi:S-DNA-T family DNA segregation ATPase FtsK/SpoIIIE